MEGSGSGMIKILHQYLFGGAEENYEKPQTGHLIHGPRFELGAF
jgi:hypothetical protein